MTTQTLPTPTGYKSMTIDSVWPGTKFETDGGKQFRLNYGTQYFKLLIEFASLTRDEARQVTGFLQSMNGQLTEFYTPLGLYGDTSGAYGRLSGPASKILSVSSTASIGTSQISYNSQWTSSYYNEGTDGNLLNIGDYITFSNHNKVYQIVEVDNPNALGEGGITVSPPLTTSVPVGFSINVEDVKMLTYLDSTIMSYSSGIKGFTELAFNLREDI